MSTKDNGAIDYRRRMRDRRSRQAAAVVTAAASNELYDPPLEPGDVVEAATPDAAVIAETATVATPSPTVTAVSRTPQVVRSQAKAAVSQLLTVSDAAYTAMMTSLAVDDPILYAAVVDEINDARAAETKTA